MDAQLNPKTSRLKATIIPKATNHANALKSKPVEQPSALILQIKSAKKLKDLTASFSNSNTIKHFHSTCYHVWITANDPPNDLVLEVPYLLEIIQTTFKKTFPYESYVLSMKDVFHQTVSMFTINSILYL
jgi:hypothetical protein